MTSLTISGTGTDVGKTYVACCLAHLLSQHGRVAALKPFETGGVADQRALCQAAQMESSVIPPVFYRAGRPLAPAGAVYEGEEPPPALEDICAAIRALQPDYDHLLVEGAGGLLVPINTEQTFADLAVELGLPLLLVAQDALGTLSHTLTAYESAMGRDLHVPAIILNRPHGVPELSQRTNARVLRDHLPIPVFVLPWLDDLQQGANHLDEQGLLQALA